MAVKTETAEIPNRHFVATRELDAPPNVVFRAWTDPKQLAAIKARILGIFGNQDKGIPPEKVNEFEAALKQAGVRAEIFRYDAPHAFANPSNPKYDEAAAADAWTHVLAFLGSLKK